MKESGKQPLSAAVADNLRMLRKRARMTQSELANLAGLSRASIAQIEGQRYSGFSLATLERIAEALGVTEAALLARKVHTVHPAFEKFRRSSWAKALEPNDAEQSLMTAVLAAFPGSASLSAETIAELLQLARRVMQQVRPA